MYSFDKTLQELSKEGGEVRLKAIVFLRNFKWETLTARQLLQILEIINQEENKNV